MTVPDEPGLFVDGVLSDGHEADLSACGVCDIVELPLLELDEDDSEPNKTGASIVNLGAHRPSGPELDLLIMGRAFGVGYTSESSNEGAVAHREIAIALPPRSVTVRRAVLSGSPAYRVTVESLPGMDTGFSCWLGRIVVRVWGESGSSLPQHAFLNIPTEFGKCE